MTYGQGSAESKICCANAFFFFTLDTIDILC